MANVLTGNPLKIDTAATINSGINWIEKMVWHEPTATHTLNITDTAGRVVWNKYALAGGSGIDYEFELESKVNGLIVTAIPSGTLYVYLK